MKKKKLELLIYKQENQKETKEKFKSLEAACWQAQERPCYFAPGTDFSPGSDFLNIVQVQRLIVILKWSLILVILLVNILFLQFSLIA